MAVMLPALATAKVAIIGLGYVGLPLAVEFGKQRQDDLKYVFEQHQTEIRH